MANKFKQYKICTRCSGTGQAQAPNGEGGSATVECPDCGGTGKVHTGFVEKYKEDE